VCSLIIQVLHSSVSTRHYCKPVEVYRLQRICMFAFFQSSGVCKVDEEWVFEGSFASTAMDTGELASEEHLIRESGKLPIYVSESL
jgi:hypothetical protein